jgi:thiamine biosynthesis protein ThiS
MKIEINGRIERLDERTTILDLLDKNRITPNTIVTELNGRIVKKDFFDTTTLSDGDRLEIVAFVGGG